MQIPAQVARPVKESQSNIRASLFTALILAFYASCIILFSYEANTTFITKIAALAVAIVFVSQAVKKNFDIPFTLEWKLAGLWIFIASIPIMAAEYSEFSTARLLTVSQVIPASFMVFCLIAWTRSPAPVWISIFITILVVSILTYRYPDSYTFYETGRKRGTFANPNHFGYALVLSVAINLALIYTIKSWLMRTMLLATLPFLVYMLGESGSRQAVVGLVFVLLTLTATKINSLRKRSVFAALALGVGGLLLISGALYQISNSSHFERTSRIFDAIDSRDFDKTGSSERVRLLFYEKAFSMGLENPMLGSGLGTFQDSFKTGYFGAKGSYAHSNYMEVFVSSGLIGFFIYYGIYWVIGMRLLRLRRIRWTPQESVTYAFTCSIFMLILIYDLTAVSYYNKFSWLILSTVAGTACTLKHRAAGRKVGLISMGSRL